VPIRAFHFLLLGLSNLMGSLLVQISTVNVARINYVLSMGSVHICCYCIFAYDKVGAPYQLGWYRIVRKIHSSHFVHSSFENRFEFGWFVKFIKFTSKNYMSFMGLS
jgi:hypothetical protein